MQLTRHKESQDAHEVTSAKRDLFMSSVSDIRFVAYAVPDFDAEHAFYRDKWGLIEVSADADTAYLAASGSSEPYVVRLRRASTKRVDLISFAAASRSAVDELFTRVKRADCQIIHDPSSSTATEGGYGFRFFSPDGLPFEISCDVKRRIGHLDSQLTAIPQGISHVVLHSPEHKAMTGFFINVLGFQLSDWIGETMAFLRCNEWHHRIAILPGPASLNHVAYDMASVEDMLRGVGKLKRLKTEVLWGPGRHTAGNNTFSYFSTPNGFSVEYTADLQRLGSDWVPNVYEYSAEVIDQWGFSSGSPQQMIHPETDLGLFQAPEL
jgi:catechol 2,3-dioxygenase-like lactoylglutathione lyase family enzyme